MAIDPSAAPLAAPLAAPHAEPPKSGQPRDPGDLRPALMEADDQKIRRVLAVVDHAADPAVNKALLDPLRPRLAALRPVRPLRFARLLFTPLDPLTVAGRGWREGDPTVPRPVLAPIASIVRAGIGDLAPVIDTIIAGHMTDATQIITRAGELLWTRAAEILVAAPTPDDWPETDLPFAAFPTLAASIAAVFRRASSLRRMALEDELGALAMDDETVRDILRDIANEPAMACAMISRLLLLRSPHAVEILARIAALGRTLDEKTALRRSVDTGLDAVLSTMEREKSFVQEIANGDLTAVSAEVRRMTTLLTSIEADTALTRHWPRLKVIRMKLDEVCRARFARGVTEGLLTPLAAASGPVLGPTQRKLESSSRDLRKLELIGRKVGGASGYDQQLLRASDAVRQAAASGLLSEMRQCRLIEILAGPDAAEAKYDTDNPAWAAAPASA